jgi:hypothetical protein
MIQIVFFSECSIPHLFYHWVQNIIFSFKMYWLAIGIRPNLSMNADILKTTDKWQFFCVYLSGLLGSRWRGNVSTTYLWKTLKLARTTVSSVTSFWFSVTSICQKSKIGWTVASTCSTRWYGAALKNMYPWGFFVAVGNCHGSHMS